MKGYKYAMDGTVAGATVLLLLVLLSGCSLLFPDVEIEVVNEGDVVVIVLSAREVTTEDWGENWLDSELVPRKAVVIYLPKAEYDFRVTFADYSTSYLYDVNLRKVEIYVLRIKGDSE